MSLVLTKDLTMSIEIIIYFMKKVMSFLNKFKKFNLNVLQLKYSEN